MREVTAARKKAIEDKVLKKTLATWTKIQELKYSFESGRASSTKELNNFKISTPVNNYTVVSINSLKEKQKDAAIRVIVVRQGILMETQLNSKSIRKLIFKDEKGDMTHELLFTSTIQQFQNQMRNNNSYLIFDPIVKQINQSFPNVNPKLELIFQVTTRIEVKPDISYALNFSFKQFADIKNNSWKDEYHDVIGIVKRVKHLVCFKTSKKPTAYRREIILINPMLDTITLTLWDDLAFNEGLLLEAMETEHPVIAFFNMKAQSYQGVNQLLSFSTTGMLRNPICAEAKDLNS
ncbi:replication protein A 70 kDa DNA-binding subunit B-like [Primulina tabacum]|uniref:replication protein A 70 kDa DNA-binding subunit B-like n=1 Tax=Primulina tabacum TaxID=48773 RepID=UPI003F5A2A00